MRLIYTQILLLTAFLFAAEDIVINEIMYNSPDADIEFVELTNISGAGVNIQGWYILDDNDDHKPCYLSGTLSSGEYLVIAGNKNLFTASYPDVTTINPNDFDNGADGWSLGNGGDAVRLYNGSGQLMDIVSYLDGGEWPGSADGEGPSLELLNPAFDNALPINWDPSAENGGTPGAVNSVLTSDVKPICKDGQRSIDLPASSDEVTVSVIAFDAENLSKVELMVNFENGYEVFTMNDDGEDSDLIACDSVFTAVIPQKPGGTLVKYYARATDNADQTETWPNDAPAEYHAYTVDYIPPDLKITEVLTVNNGINQDSAGEFDDWFEIYNNDTKTVNLSGMFVGNSFGNSRQFELPAVELSPDNYLLIWADNDTEQGSMHVNFKLSSKGESVALFESVDCGNVLIHGWKYGRTSADISMGYQSEDATAPDYLQLPTPGASNDNTGYFSAVCINEFQSTSAFGGQDDWIEIYNRGNSTVDLSGCFLSDERGDNAKWSFPTGTTLEAGVYLVIYEDALGFGFSSEGDDVIMLTAPDSTTGLDFYDFGPQQADKSEGRYPDGSGVWQQFDTPTRGSTNNNNTPITNKPECKFPQTIVLYPNYPNPFNPTTTIQYYLPEKSDVVLTVFNISGCKVETLVNQSQTSGRYFVKWDASRYPSGVYFYKIQADGWYRNRKCILMK